MEEAGENGTGSPVGPPRRQDDVVPAAGSPVPVPGAGAPGSTVTLRWEAGANPGQPVLRIGGALDRRGVGLVRDTLQQRLADEPTGVVIDLSGCLVSDRPSLLVFGAIARQAAAWPGCPVALFGATTAVQRAMHRMAIDRYLLVCAGGEQARRLAVAPAGSPRLRETLPPEPASVPVARALAGNACIRWHLPGLSGDAQLVTAELIGNGVRHARTRLELLLRAAGGYLHIGVRDWCPRPPAWGASPRRGSEASSDVGHGGRGLLLVHSFADVSGHTFTADGKVVWATLRQQR